MTEKMRSCIFSAVDLQDFREAVGATQYEVAAETGLDQSTISRIEARKVRPTAEAMLLIDAWAMEAAQRKRLRASQRLTWEWLLREPREPAA